MGPTTIGKYRKLAELGSGGMASVFLAVMHGHGGFHKLVVLKIPKDEVYQDPNVLAMFLDEARIAARLNHPNVVQTFEVIREGDRDAIVMEYLDGYTLNELIVRAERHGTPLPRELHLRIVREALTGLHYAHETTNFDGTSLALVHRDVSPHNLFVTFDGQVKILDFGIAKASTQSHQTELGTFKGKVRYMPKEQLAGSGMDRRTDVFAVGTMIWEAATSERLWQKRSDVEVMSAIIAGDVPMPCDARPDAPRELDAICRRAMAHDKTHRYPTCVELQRDLDQWLDRSTTPSTMRDVVAFLETVFAEQRAHRNRIIEAQLKTVNVDDTAPLPALGPLSGRSSVPPTFGPTPSAPAPPGPIALAPAPKSRTPLVALLVAIPLLLVGLAAVAGVVMALRTKGVAKPAAAAANPTTTATTTAEVGSAATLASAEPPMRASSEAPPAPPSVTMTPATTTPLHTIAANPRTPAPPRARNEKPVVAAPTKPAAGEPGFLSFQTYPWTRVSEGGRLLGTTPLYRVPLSPGVHVLTLENAEENVKTTYTVTIKSGEGVNRNMALK